MINSKKVVQNNKALLGYSNLYVVRNDDIKIILTFLTRIGTIIKI